ncbi:MAG: ATP-binding protein [bacterium]|nr:ATP-binding protein [bacterium]
MLYTKPITEITYVDVIDFCKQSLKENINLDYKLDVDTGIAKTIAAMANTWGGLIVVGVEDEDSKPKLPVEGIPYREHIEEQINNIILGNITPPTFPEVKVCLSENKEKMFVVIRIPQSNLTPHAIRGNTRVYIRTNTSNEPEEEITIEKLGWLVDKRKKSLDLKEQLHQEADRRFEKLCRIQGIKNFRHNDVSLMTSPLYPFEILTKKEQLIREIPERMRTEAWGRYFPKTLHRTSYEAINGGSYAFISNGQSGYFLYEEFNHYGLFYHREDWCKSDKDEETGEIKHTGFLHSYLSEIDLMIESASKFYSAVGYWGLVEIKVIARELEEVNFRDLPAPKGFYKFDKLEKRPIDNNLEFTKEVSVRELVEKRVALVTYLMLDLSWALGFTHIDEEGIGRLLEEQGRL